jgi:hypothetical protein
MARPDGGMFSIKLIHPNHLKYTYLTDDFDGTDGRWPLMDFSSDGKGPSIAANIRVGHRALVYVIHHHKFIWAIEYIGNVEQGRQAATSHGILPNDITTKWNTFLPIRFLARVDLDSAPTPEDIYERTGILFKPNRFTMKYIPAREYHAIFNAIRWHQTAAFKSPK